MREITMWKETPTAPYSLKTFFSCWVLFGFPPSGSGSSGVFAVDEELIEASFKFCFSWTRKKKNKREQKVKVSRTLENLSVRRQTAHLDKNKQKIWLAKRKWMKLVDGFHSEYKILKFFTFIFQRHPSSYKTGKLQDKGLTSASTDVSFLDLNTQGREAQPTKKTITLIT